MIFELIQDDFLLSVQDLRHLIRTAPKRYYEWEIDKKGSDEKRRLAQPAREIKSLQYWLMENFLQRLPVHEVATAYRAGGSILLNAKAHKKNDFILKLDFKKFFHSILPKDLNRVVRSNFVELAAEDRYVINQIVFWGQKTRTPKCLSIGAPSSPLISNAIMFDYDTRMVEIARDCQVTVTRYADDITASANEVEKLLSFERKLRAFNRGARSPILNFNDDKRGLYGRGQRRMVTGLILTPNGTVSVGRQRKRELAALIHHFSEGRLAVDDVRRAKGLLAFATDVDPTIRDWAERKYGADIVSRLRKADVAKRSR